MKRVLYDLIYRFVPVDWVFGSTSGIEKIVDLAVDGRIKPGKAITLGCGVGRETIHLAKKGFEVIGLDFSPAAIRRARKRAEDEGLDLEFVVDDLTDIKHVSGTFDLVMDFGALNDLNQAARNQYMENVMPLIKPDGHYVMFCFDKTLPPLEVRRRFGESFSITNLHERSELPEVPPLYWMKWNKKQ